MKGGYVIAGIVILIAGFFFGRSFKNLDNESADQVEERRSIVPTVFSSESLSDSENSTIKLFEKAVPSVAFITTASLEQNYWNRNVTEIPRGSGSGFVWDSEGHIVTNFHVIQGADKATVTLQDQTSYPAVVVGVAPDKDLAVLKISADSNFTALPLGISENLKVGQAAFAIGNPFGLDYTLTTGIISALGREINSVSDIKIKNVIQTDAAINPGNSGGPLLNSSGELIGVNTAIYSPTGAYAGIGFSIPVDEVKWVVPDLIKYGKIRRPILGVELLRGTIAKDRYGLDGALIMNTIKGKAAEKAGLRGMRRDRRGNMFMGDLIVEIDGKSVVSNSDLVLLLEKYEFGDEVQLSFIRDNKKQKTTLILSEN